MKITINKKFFLIVTILCLFLLIISYWFLFQINALQFNDLKENQEIHNGWKLTSIGEKYDLVNPVKIYLEKNDKKVEILKNNKLANLNLDNLSFGLYKDYLIVSNLNLGSAGGSSYFVYKINSDEITALNEPYGNYSCEKPKVKNNQLEFAYPKEDNCDLPLYNILIGDMNYYYLDL